ncbi:pirin family protein [uncultured Veillonella sp.]|uniref:pirin family protein n=1 Tax=uncultured Veillonella sp. TaxID=159268 RepID=UPI0026000B99|nr:pirin family protein [uncultured Veillonella sp.]
MKRTIKTTIKGFRTIDGAGVNLVRVLGNSTIEEYDPILMLDSFDSVNPDEYTAGFPMHPHRGIETISYVSRGNMVHRDSLGNEEAIGDGEVQWMNSGSGILHEELVPAAERLLGVQLWLNLPKKDKMSKPSYHSIKREQIEEIKFDGGMLRLLAGQYVDANGVTHEGFKGEHLPLNYYDVHMETGASVTFTMAEDASVMLFTLLGEVYVEGQLVEEKTAVKLTKGTSVAIKVNEGPVQVLYIQSMALQEPTAWAGPIVMNTEAEVQEAFHELRNGTFIKEQVAY